MKRTKAYRNADNWSERSFSKTFDGKDRLDQGMSCSYAIAHCVLVFHDNVVVRNDVAPYHPNHKRWSLWEDGICDGQHSPDRQATTTLCYPWSLSMSLVISVSNTATSTSKDHSISPIHWVLSLQNLHLFLGRCPFRGPSTTPWNAAYIRQGSLEYNENSLCSVFRSVHPISAAYRLRTRPLPEFLPLSGDRLLFRTHREKQAPRDGIVPNNGEFVGNWVAYTGMRKTFEWMG